MTFEKLTFQLSNSEEQLGNLYDAAVSTLLINLPGPFWLICCDNWPLTLLMTLTWMREGISIGYMYAYESVLIFTIQFQQYKWLFEKSGIMKLLQHSNSHACF